MLKTSKKQLEYAKRHSEKLRRFVLRLHKEQDAELIKVLDDLPKGSINNTLKQAITEYLLSKALEIKKNQK